MCSALNLAEGEGFEPPEPFRVQWFSRPPPSTTRPSLRVGTSPAHFILLSAIVGAAEEASPA